MFQYIIKAPPLQGWTQEGPCKEKVGKPPRAYELDYATSMPTQDSSRDPYFIQGQGQPAKGSGHGRNGCPSRVTGPQDLSAHGGQPCQMIGTLLAPQGTVSARTPGKVMKELAPNSLEAVSPSEKALLRSRCRARKCSARLFVRPLNDPLYPLSNPCVSQDIAA